MRRHGREKRLTVHVGESDRGHHKPLHVELVHRAHAAGPVGATVLRGIEGFGASRHVHTSRILSLTEDLPVVVLVDAAERMERFALELEDLVTEAASPGQWPVWGWRCCETPRRTDRPRTDEVGRGGVEPPTSRFSGERSYRLSYLPRPVDHRRATLTGLEPATSAVTGRRANQLRYRALHRAAVFGGAVPPTGFEPVLPP
jgi:uncharacterized protein